MNDLVIVRQNNEPMVKTFDLFKGFGYATHRMLKKVIDDNKDSFLTMGFVQLELHKPKKGSKGGRPEESYLLNERQFTLLVMLVKNSPASVDLKLRVANEFFRIREELKKVHSRTEILEQYKKFMLLDTPSEWVKLYPPEFYSAIMRLYNQAFVSNKGTPPYCGQITRKWIYDVVLPPELRELVPSGDEVKRHQWFTEQGGRAALTKQIDAVTGLARACQSRADFEARAAAAFLGQPLQLSFFI